MHVERLARLLGGFSYRYASEVQLHERLEEVLQGEGMPFEREYRIDDKNRADFFLDGIVIEVKVDGSLSEAIRQVDRYLGLDVVRGVLLASTSRWAEAPLRADIRTKGWRGKPFAMARLRRQAL
jgi:hypothetical protein